MEARNPAWRDALDVKTALFAAAPDFEPWSSSSLLIFKLGL